MSKEHRIIRKVRELVAAAPENTYQPPPEEFVNDAGEIEIYGEADSCRYIYHGKGSCLFGQAMIATKDLSVDNEKVEGATVDLILTEPTEYLGKRIKLPADQLVWATRVQRGQDSGKTWGEAIAYADKTVGLQLDPTSDHWNGDGRKGYDYIDGTIVPIEEGK